MRTKLLIALFTICFASPTLAGNHQARSHQLILITKLYKEVYENKDTSLMNKYFSKNLSFQINFDRPVNYESLKRHLIKINQQCTSIKILPFDQALVIDNKIILLYTQSCVDSTMTITKKRIMAITEIDDSDKVVNIQAVTNEQI